MRTKPSFASSDWAKLEIVQPTWFFVLFARKRGFFLEMADVEENLDSASGVFVHHGLGLFCFQQTYKGLVC